MPPPSISSMRDGNSARQALGDTAPWPLPGSRKFAERSATDGSSIVGPAMEPIWIQSRARPRVAEQCIRSHDRHRHRPRRCQNSSSPYAIAIIRTG